MAVQKNHGLNILGWVARQALRGREEQCRRVVLVNVMNKLKTGSLSL
jgi:hypothetical protein